MKNQTANVTTPAADLGKSQLKLANAHVLDLTFRNHKLKAEIKTLRRDNRELRKAAQIDAKTKVLNLEGFTRQTRAAIQHAFGRRDDAPHHEALAVLYMDIDDFGLINKEYGEPAGDKCLLDVVAFLRKTIRDSDVIARNGLAADEFVIAFPNATAADVIAIFARLESAARGPSVTVRYRNRSIHLTLSGGVTDYRAGEHLKETIRRANLAMRHVKANLGKARIEAYADGVTPDTFPRRRPRAEADRH